MDVLRKELNAFYESQQLEEEELDYRALAECRRKIEIAVEIENDCRVITDAAADHCYIYGGSLSFLIGVTGMPDFKDESDEVVKIPAFLKNKWKKEGSRRKLWVNPSAKHLRADRKWNPVLIFDKIYGGKGISADLN